MKAWYRHIGNIVFAGQVLLAFLLLFEEQISVPAWVQLLGRLHPLVLHLPIGLLILLALLPLMGREAGEAAMRKVQSFVLHLAAFMATFTALAGLLLAQEDGYEAGVLLDRHKWTGAGLSLLTYGLLLLHERWPLRSALYRGVLGLNVALLILAGHLGASLTHGEDFLLAPVRRAKPEITGQTSIYAAAVEPILQKKCFSCHNERKAKGGLIMTSTASFLEGGEDGPVILAGDAGQSPLIQRILLPAADEAHMPPRGKPQLEESEIELLKAWIAAGADFGRKIAALTPGDPLYPLLTGRLTVEEATAGGKISYDFAFAPEAKVRSLNTPFRTVSPLAVNEPALQAEIFVREAYQPRMLEELLEVREQIISLYLANLPIGDASMALIGRFPNLEKLTLNGTDITGSALGELRTCRRLSSLALAGTAVDTSIAGALAQLPALREVFIWNTRISPDQVPDLQRQFPDILFQGGFMAQEDEILKLTPPLLKNQAMLLDPGEPVVLKHNFPGVHIRYTIDGAAPDSLTGQWYDQPFPVDGFTTVKARAFKEKWIPSEVAEFAFFQRGLSPQEVVLETSPNEKYQGNGPGTLTDGEKGDPENFLSPFWLGYQDNSFAARFSFGSQPPLVRRVIFSYLQNIGSYIMPPTLVEIWGGDDEQHLQPLARVAPLPLQGYGPNQVRGLSLDIPPGHYRCIKVQAQPVKRLPDWHQGKGDKGWVFVDEVFFY